MKKLALHILSILMLCNITLAENHILKLNCEDFTVGECPTDIGCNQVQRDETSNRDSDDNRTTRTATENYFGCPSGNVFQSLDQNTGKPYANHDWNCFDDQGYSTYCVSCNLPKNKLILV